MSLLLQIIVIYIKENIITKLQKLYSPPPKKCRTGNKSPVLFVEKPRHMGEVSPARKIFIERPADPSDLTRRVDFWTDTLKTHYPQGLNNIDPYH